MPKEKYEMCLRITSDALSKLVVVKEDGISERLLSFINDYVSDAKHFAEKKEWATALEAIAYAHGILDGGVLEERFKIDGYHLP